MVDATPHAAMPPPRSLRNAPRLTARLALLLAAILLAPSGQAWQYVSNAPVRVDVDVNAEADPDPESPEASAGATVLVCSEPDVWNLDVKPDPGWVTVWVPLGTQDSGAGSRKTTAGCGQEGDEAPAEVTVWVDQHPWGLI